MDENSDIVIGKEEKRIKDLDEHEGEEALMEDLKNVSLEGHASSSTQKESATDTQGSDTMTVNQSGRRDAIPEFNPENFLFELHVHSLVPMTSRLSVPSKDVRKHFPAIGIPAETHDMERLWFTDAQGNCWCLKITTSTYGCSREYVLIMEDEFVNHYTLDDGDLIRFYSHVQPLHSRHFLIEIVKGGAKDTSGSEVDDERNRALKQMMEGTWCSNLTHSGTSIANDGVGTSGYDRGQGGGDGGDVDDDGTNGGQGHGAGGGIRGSGGGKRRNYGCGDCRIV